MTPRPLHHAVRTAVLLGVLLHSIAIFAVWKTWGEFGRGNLLAWIDFPASLAFLHLDGTPLLLWSLAAGGLQWAIIAALLSFSLGRAARGRPR
ncbi:MAG TPA: hypothetical protein VGG20_24340 [Thermoanaerobaculia bacterium]|jgi:hypothetical protein